MANMLRNTFSVTMNIDDRRFHFYKVLKRFAISYNFYKYFKTIKDNFKTNKDMQKKNKYLFL